MADKMRIKLFMLYYARTRWVMVAALCSNVFAATLFALVHHHTNEQHQRRCTCVGFQPSGQLSGNQAAWPVHVQGV